MINSNLTEKTTSNFSLEKHLNLLEKEIQLKNTQFRKLRQDLFILNSDLNKVNKNDKLKKIQNDNEINFKIKNLDERLKEHQTFNFNQIIFFNSELKDFSEDTCEMDCILKDLEDRLNVCQDKIGMFE